MIMLIILCFVAVATYFVFGVINVFRQMNKIEDNED
jgi:hypothetical protein